MGWKCNEGRSAKNQQDIQTTRLVMKGLGLRMATQGEREAQNVTENIAVKC